MRHQTRSTSGYHHRDRHRFSRSRSHSNTHRYRSHNQNNSHRSCSRSYHRYPHKEAHHATDTQKLIITDGTHHIGGLPHIETSTHSRHCSRSRPCTSHKARQRASSKPSYSSNKTELKHKDKKYKKVTIDDPPSDYYSSDDPSSDSEEDLN